MRVGKSETFTFTNQVNKKHNSKMIMLCFSHIIGSPEKIENLKTLDDSKMDGVAFSSDIVQKIFNLKYPERHLGFTKDHLYMYSLVFVFKQKSPLTKLFNEKFQSLQEMGIIDLWMSKHIGGNGLISKRRTPTMLEPKNIVEAFQICAVLYLISFIVFILEILSVRFQFIKCILDFFNY